MSSNKFSNGRRVAKNTLMLYSRMLLLLLVSLYTAKVMLDALGTVDYGLNNVVAGVVALFTFLNGTLNTSTSRYLNYEMGKGSLGDLKKVFSAAFFNHGLLALVVVFLGETVGLFIVNNVLTIPEGRLFACNVTFQIVIINTFLILIQTPYSALVISYETMNLYAYLGIFEAVAKLGTCFAVQYIQYDRLITLSVLQLMVHVIVFLIYYLYCKRKHKTVAKIVFKIDRQLSCSMLKFTSWGVLGSLARMLKTQGISVLINIFCGPAVNAANGIAYRINSAIMGFTTGFTMALNPQITKTYAANQMSDMKKLLFRGGKFSFFLLLFLGLPLIFEMRFVLRMWLGDSVPAYTADFAILVLLLSMIESYTYSIGCAIQATGNIRNYQLVISGITLLNFPVSYIFFRVGFSPTIALKISVCISFVTLIVRLFFMERQLSIRPSDYIKNVFLRTIPVGFLCSIIPYGVSTHLDEGCKRFFLLVSLSTLSNLFIVYWIGMNREERAFVKDVVAKKIRRGKK